MYESDLQWGWTVTQQEFLFNPSLQYPFLLRSACCCFVTLSTSRGPALPRHLANEARALTYTQRIAYFHSNPGRLTTCQLRTRNLPLSPPYEPLCTGGVWGGGQLCNTDYASRNNSSCLFLTDSSWGQQRTPPLLSPRFFPQSFHLLLPGNPILFGVCDEGHSPSPHCSSPPSSRYTLGETREWGFW